MAKKVAEVATATVPAIAETPVGLFDSAYGATKDEVKAQKKELVRNTNKRAFRAAYDSAKGQLIDANISLDDLRRNVEKFDVSSIIKKKAEIANIQKTLTAIAEEYTVMHGTEMAVVED